MNGKRSAQSILEYVVLIAIVVTAIGGMKMYLLRSVKAQFKVMQDRVGDPNKDTKTTTTQTKVTP